jgi:exosortase
MDNQEENGILEDFRIEFLDCWRRLPNKGLFFFLLVAWLALFQFLGNCTLGYVATPSLLQWMYEVYKPNNNPNWYDDSHARIVPFVVLGLFWLKRRQLVEAPLKEWLPGLGLIGAGLVMHIAGYAVQQPRISIIALFTGIYGLMGLAWGPEFLRKSFFPFVLFAFCVPLGTLALPLTFGLRLLSCQVVEFLCHNVLAIDIIRLGTQLQDPSGRYSYEVAAACSGMRSLIAVVALAIVYGVLSFRSWWRRGVLLASAFPLAVLGNTVRLLTIILAAQIFGHEAGEKVHEGGPMGIYSLLPYIPAFAGMLLVGHWLREPAAQPERKPAAAAPQKALGT